MKKISLYKERGHNEDKFLYNILKKYIVTKYQTVPIKTFFELILYKFI